MVKDVIFIFISKYPVVKDEINYLVEVSDVELILDHKYNVCIYMLNDKNKFFKWNKYKEVYSKYWSYCDIRDIRNSDDFLISIIESTFEDYFKEVGKEKQKENEKNKIEKQRLALENWNGIIT